MRMRRIAFVALGGVLLLGSSLAGSRFTLASAPTSPVAGAADLFPHDRHARLFPVCQGCHQGVPTGDRAQFYPAPAQCASCHNGTDQRRVDWTGPTARATNIKFTHPTHEKGAGQVECSTCHVQAGGARMSVAQRVEPAQCFSCHAHETRSHYNDAPCAQCHVAIAQTSLSRERVAALPVPATHKEPNFFTRDHGRLAASEPARCAVCHTRETCATCHVDAAGNKTVQMFATAPASLAIPTITPKYFRPKSHDDRRWVDAHGASAKKGDATCASCHTRESCLTCHTGKIPAVVTALPARVAVVAPGVSTTRAAPTSHTAPFFDREHGTLAASRPQTCMSCHTRTTCETCHTSAGVGREVAQLVSAPAPASARAQPVALSAQSPHAIRSPAAAKAAKGSANYHASNFIERHASASYGRNLDCQNCHETASFCRTCHERRGMGSDGRLQPGFHDAEPNWLLNHGRPARQGMESCASCHKQKDCVQCHSETGAFRINPHGPGFDAKRMIERNPRVCYACHLTDPTRGKRL